VAASATAQTPAERLFQTGVVTVGIAGGGAAFSAFQRGQALAGSTEFDRRLSAQTTVAVSGTVTWWLARHWGARLHGSYSPSRFVLNEAEQLSGRVSAEASLARLGVFMADFDILFRAPIVWGRVAPYGLVGAGAVEYRADPALREPIPAEAATSFESGTRRRFAGVFGVGARIPLDDHAFHLTFELTNHLTRSPVDSPVRGMTREGVYLDPDGWGTEDDGAGLTSNVRLMIGLAMPIHF
jgi:hypothetical protein